MTTAKRSVLIVSACIVMCCSSLAAIAQMKVTYDNGPIKKATKPKTEFIEKMPEFAGDLSAFLSANLQYPDSARARGQQGRAVVEFIVSETGLVRDIHIKQTSGVDLLDEEAMRLLRMMQFTPYWKPGTQKGVPVPVIFTLPITFQLD